MILNFYSIVQRAIDLKIVSTVLYFSKYHG
ncbi:hypothetical protein ABIE49_006723 [Bradyrhizobium sp. OAE829]